MSHFFTSLTETTRHILVINTSTADATTQRVSDLLQLQLPKNVHLHTRTAQFAAKYIACEASHTAAAHALLDVWVEFFVEEKIKLDGVLIACFVDPGLFALRQSSACPVTGLAETSMMEAAQQGGFAIVTGGALWKPMLKRLAQNLGFEQQLKHIEIVAPTGAELMAAPAMALRCLTAACQIASQVQGVKTLILGGAGLVGYAKQIQHQVNLPIIDSVEAGGRMILSGELPAPTANQNAFITQWQAMSPAISAMQFL